MHVGIAVTDTDKVGQGLSQEYHDHMHAIQARTDTSAKTLHHQNIVLAQELV
jgi:hypothetical protein